MLENVIFRKDEIIKICCDKKVLHLGFIQHKLYEQKIKSNDWLHSKIAEVAGSLVGFDYLQEDVEILKDKYGYIAYYADVTQLDKLEYQDKFDIVVCGELIEHIENPGLMLDGIKRFMHDESLLIITTPNPWSNERIRLIRSGKLENLWLNKEHVCWYSFETLKQLLDRKGYVEKKYDYYYSENKNMFFKTESFLDYIKILKRILVCRLTKRQSYDGLFFIAKTKSRHD